jgi:rhodanese-related sulfurtransferase
MEAKSLKRDAILSCVLLSLIVFVPTGAKVAITPEMNDTSVDVMGRAVKIERIQDTSHRLRNSYARTSRPCPPFCIEPFQPVDGVETVGELELLKFLSEDVKRNEGTLVDARMSKWYREGTIPGAVNIPFSILSAKGDNPYLDRVLLLLGAYRKSGEWNFDKAQKLIVFDNGPWCGQARTAIENLVEIGYPKRLIRYYRGGMQYWQILGLTTIRSKRRKSER